MTQRFATLIFIGMFSAAGCAREHRESEPVVWEKGLEFLEPVPELRGISINMSEDQFRGLIRHRDVTVREHREGNEASYDVRTRSGENVVVMFTDGQCSGIQRLAPDVPLP